MLIKLSNCNFYTIEWTKKTNILLVLFFIELAFQLCKEYWVYSLFSSSKSKRFNLRSSRCELLVEFVGSLTKLLLVITVTMLELEKKCKTRKRLKHCSLKTTRFNFFWMCQNSHHTITFSYSFLDYFLVFIHHQHGHKVTHIDVYRYKIGINHHLSKYDNFWFINMYGNQNIG